jgi:branched-chain amino acid transport system ATP-binding protein
MSGEVFGADGLTAGYGSITVLREVSLSVDDGEILSVVGPNGAGKTTLMRTLAGLIVPTQGTIRLRGEDVTGTDADERVAHGVALVSEGRNLFREMTVRENLLLGAYAAREDRDARDDRLEEVLGLFPRLEERRSQAAGTLSGGEAQMLAIGRGLMADPSVLLLDEPSMGLAPKLVPEVFDRIREINAGGVAVVLVEQRADEALELADTACLLENGEVHQRGPAATLREDEELVRKYLGGAS